MIVEIKEEKILRGLEQVEKCLFYPLKEKFTSLKAEKSSVNALTVKDGAVEIGYTDFSGFYTALGVALASEGNFSSEIRRKINDTGIMIDCARNAVIRAEQAKKMIVVCALLGYNYFELYVEDCFEVDDEPCFGYMRGRFTKAELKDLDEFAALFGIELVPCIQTLAHLARIFFHWKEYTMKIQDKGDVLLVGEERTYRLIENMIRTCREC
ncbi:MAG: hypothetical protein SOT34_02390, partial [Candidatus Borkfalkiaceae bacterium]|nr:hypothetical protein [Christensenellaceae bacterium]